MPLPVLPDALATPLLSSVIRLLVSVILAVGVKVAVQVIPPSLLLTALKVPFSTVRSALLKPLTASLNVMVTSEVSPMDSALSATTTVAVGRTVSMVKLPELVTPAPALPARSATPALFRLIRLVVSATLAPGVKVAVQVMPPSPLLTALSVPFGTLRSLLSKPLTASLNVMVTSEVSPTLRALSATTILAVGRAESMA
ncbi:hypothetical protein ALP75_202708 [Pseudomonas syringae pv. actinidiae]|nr:hypothetical protein ALP75_202708 [Pseudomonas syringae pv. actinidiae]